MEPEVEIVNQQQVDAVHAESHLRLFVRPHDPVVAVVMHVIEPEPAGPRLGLELLRLGRRKEPAPHLARQNKFGPRLRIEEAATTDLGQTPPVIGRSVVVAYADVPGRLQRGGGRRFVDPHEEFTERRAAEAQLGELDRGLPELSCFERIHRRQPPANLFGPERPSTMGRGNSKSGEDDGASRAAWPDEFQTGRPAARLRLCRLRRLRRRRSASRSRQERSVHKIAQMSFG